MSLFFQEQPSSVQMILRTPKLRRGDTVIEQVPSAEHPFREVTLTDVMIGECAYRGEWHEIRYLTGLDRRTGKKVMYTGTEYRTWQILRQC